MLYTYIYIYVTNLAKKVNIYSLNMVDIDVFCLDFLSRHPFERVLSMDQKCTG